MHHISQVIDLVNKNLIRNIASCISIQSKSRNSFRPAILIIKLKRIEKKSTAFFLELYEGIKTSIKGLAGRLFTVVRVIKIKYIYSHRPNQT